MHAHGCSRVLGSALTVLNDGSATNLGRASDVVVASNVEGLFTYVSPACRSLLGYTPAELIGKRMASFVHPEDVLRVLSGAAGAAAEVSGRSVTARYRRRDGSYAWIEQRIARITDAETGVLLEMRAVLRDAGDLMTRRSSPPRQRVIADRRSPGRAPTLIGSRRSTRTRPPPAGRDPGSSRGLGGSG